MASPKNTLKSVIFDLDGTLIDTEQLAAQAIEACFRDWNVALNPEHAHAITGRTWENAFLVIFKDIDLPLSKDDAAQKIIEVYRKKLREEALEVPGAVDCVRALKEEGVQLALVSGSHRSEIFTALDILGIRECFSLILGAEDYARSKPAPDGFLKAVKTLGLEAESTLVFEDSAAGIASARASGLYVIAITATNHHGQDQSAADDHIEDLRAITRDWIREATGKSLLGELASGRYVLDPKMTDPARIKKEREKGRELKKSAWWKKKIQAGLCHYCQKKYKASELTLDHVVPLARGGTSSKNNCVPACKNCNQHKKLDTPADQLLKDGAD